MPLQHPKEQDYHKRQQESVVNVHFIFSKLWIIQEPIAGLTQS